MYFRDLLENMNRKNIQVVAWTVNDARQMLYFADSLRVGVARISSDMSEKVEKCVDAYVFNGRPVLRVNMATA